MSQENKEKEKKTREPLVSTRGDRTYVIFPGAGKQGVESDVQVHGLFQEDIEQGIRCGQCSYWASQKDALGREFGSYNDIVQRVHGTVPHVQREQTDDKPHGLLRQILEKIMP